MEMELGKKNIIDIYIYIPKMGKGNESILEWNEYLCYAMCLVLYCIASTRNCLC